MPGPRLAARVPGGISPGAFDGDRNSIPEKGRAGFALGQCKTTAARSHTAPEPLPLAMSMNHSVCSMMDLPDEARTIPGSQGSRSTFAHGMSIQPGQRSAQLRLPPQEGRTQSGVLSAPRLVTEGKMEKKTPKIKNNEGSTMVANWVGSLNAPQLLGTNANCNSSFLRLSQHKSQSPR